MAGFFHDECSLTPELRAIGKEFVGRLCDQTAIIPEEIVLGAHDLAGPYYRTLWGTLSRDEKLALAQLAHEGLVNPKNHVLVAQLMKKGLIVRDPSFRLMNRSFTRFVISALPPPPASRDTERSNVFESDWSNQWLSLMTVKKLYLAAVERLARIQALQACVPRGIQSKSVLFRGDASVDFGKLGR
jgi:hypothetical protein